MLLVKNCKEGRDLVLKRQIFRSFVWISIMHFVIGKNEQMFKSYICLFPCATTNNVHLELTPSMDASGVNKALVRFLSRKGCIKMFISDNFSRFKSDEVSNFYYYIILIRNLFYHGGEVSMNDLSEQLKTLYKRF